MYRTAKFVVTKGGVRNLRDPPRNEQARKSIANYTQSHPCGKPTWILEHHGRFELIQCSDFVRKVPYETYEIPSWREQARKSIASFTQSCPCGKPTWILKHHCRFELMQCSVFVGKGTIRSLRDPPWSEQARKSITNYTPSHPCGKPTCFLEHHGCFEFMQCSKFAWRSGPEGV
jgi:hypothetical protein